MFKTIAIGAAAAVTALTAMPAAAEAQYYRGGYDSGYSNYDRYNSRAERRYYRDQRRAERRYYRDGRRYNNGYYGQNSNYYGRNSRYSGQRYCRDSGTTGTIIGAVAGGLLGREVVGRYGDRTIGTIVGGAAGALAGRAIDRNC